MRVKRVTARLVNRENGPLCGAESGSVHKRIYPRGECSASVGALWCCAQASWRRRTPGGEAADTKGTDCNGASC